MRIKSSFEEDFKNRSNTWLWRDVSQLTTRKRRIETLVSHQLSSLFHHEQKQMSYKLLSLNSHTNSCLSTLTQTLVYQLFYICFITSKLSRNNCHTTSLSLQLSQAYLFHHEQGESKQTLVHPLSYK